MIKYITHTAGVSIPLIRLSVLIRSQTCIYVILNEIHNPNSGKFRENKNYRVQGLGYQISNDVDIP